jgi:uncharacterized GH25 family protein
MSERRHPMHLLVLCLWSCCFSTAHGYDNRPAPAAASTAKGRSILVKVVTEEGQPVAGANVHVSVWTDEPFERNRDLPTDVDGQVVAPLPTSLDIMRLWASHDGFVPLFANWDIKRHTDFDDYPREFTFVLPKGTVIGGVIQDESGKPIADALVEVALHTVQPEIPSGVARPIVSIWLAEGESAIKTDAEGRWSLSNMPAGDEHQVRLKLTHPDFISTGWFVAPAEDAPLLHDLRARTAVTPMKSGAVVTGLVVYPEGQPLPGAVVVWGDDPYLEDGSQETRADAGGFFRIPPQPPGTQWVTVVAPGWSPLRQLVDFQQGQPPLKIQVESGRTLQVRFVDDEGKAVPGVGVGIVAWRGSKSLYNHRHPNVLDTKIPAKSDDQGRYDWTWAPDDEVTFSFYKQGYRYVEEYRLAAGDQPHVVTLERGGEEE